jgi:hypothetical protein
MVLFYIKTLITLIICTSFNSIAANNENLKTVIVEGVGTTTIEATQNAVQNALTNAVGSYMDSSKILEKKVQIIEGIQKQSTTLNTSIKEYSKGTIRNIEILQVKNLLNLIQVTAKVTISEDEFKTYIKSFTEGETTINEGLFATLNVQDKQKKDLASFVSDIFDPILNGEVFQIQVSKPMPYELIEQSILSRDLKALGFKSLHDFPQIQQWISKAGKENIIFFDLNIVLRKDFKDSVLRTLKEITLKEYRNIEKSSIAFSQDGYASVTKDSFSIVGIAIKQNNVINGYTTKLSQSAISQKYSWLNDCANEDLKSFGKRLQINFKDENEIVLLSVASDNREYVYRGTYQNSIGTNYFFNCTLGYTPIGFRFIDFDVIPIKLFMKIDIELLKTAKKIEFKFL